MTDEEAAARGERAALELEQTADAFERVRQAAIAALIETSTGQEAARERLIVTCQVLDAVKAALLDVVGNGQVARHALAKQNLLRR